MHSKLLKLSLVVLILAMAASAFADTLMDQSAFDNSVPGYFNAVAGAPPFGSTVYTVSDITVGAGGWTIDSMSIFVNALGGYHVEVTQAFLNVFPKTGGIPVDAPNQDTLVPVTVTMLGNENYQVTASGLNLDLAEGEYWIGLSPMASSFNAGVHLAAEIDQQHEMESLSWDTTFFNPNANMWDPVQPGYDAAILIEGTGTPVVGNEDVSFGTLKSLYR